MRKKYIVLFILAFITINIFIPSNIKSIIKIPRDIINLVLKKSPQEEVIDEVINEENIELKKEINILKEQLELNNLIVDKSITNATIISRNLNEWNKYLIIDKGSLNNIRDNMAVLFKGYLIGLTTNTSFYSSEVKLLTNDYINNISVKIEDDNKEIYGILKRNKNGLIIEGVTSKIKPNSLITTSGLTNIPAGLKIGYVDKIIKDNYDLASYITIYNDIDMDAINYVMVVSKK